MALEFFDCNAQIGKFSTPTPDSFFTGKELVENLTRCGISRALVYHSLALEWHPAEGNEHVFSEIEGLPFEPAWVVMPHHCGDFPGPRDLVQLMRKRKVGAVRVYPTTHQWRLADWCAGDLFSALEGARIPVLLDLGQTNFDEVQALLAAHPLLPMVLLRTSYRCDRYIYPLFERYPNFAIESGGYQATGGIEAIVERFGARTLVFGTGAPLTEPGAAVTQITYADISDADKTAIAGGNLRRIISWR